ncbi:MAG: helix-turn-helix transcriptional regulator [Gammaproteobacteria bacterium]
MELSKRISLAQAIGGRLKLLRQRAGFTAVKDFAMTCDIPESTYYQYETGKRAIPLETLLKYSELFKVNIEWLLTGQGPKEKNAKETEARHPDQLSPIKNRIELVDVHLLQNIFKALVPLLKDHAIALEASDYSEFYIDIYNNIINLSATSKEQELIMDMLVNSLLQFSRKNHHKMIQQPEGISQSS